MPYTPQDVRALGKNAGTDVQLKVGANGDIYVLAQGSDDGGTTLRVLKTAATGDAYVLAQGSDDGGTTLRVLKTDADGSAYQVMQGSDDAGATLRIVKTDASGRVVITGDAAAPVPVTIADVTPGTDVMEAGEVTGVAASASNIAVTGAERTPANGQTLTVEHVNIGGTGALRFEVVEDDGLTPVVIARGYTSQGAPNGRIDLGRRYSLVGDGTLKLLVRVDNLDAISTADASAEIVGSEATT